MSISKLEGYTRRVIPQVYDEAMSYQELLYKILEKLNEMIDETNELVETQMQKWIDDGTIQGMIDDVVFRTITKDTVYLIPTDYGTLQGAVDDILTKTVAQGVKIELRIESGHAPTSGIEISHADLSNVRVTSVAPVVQVGNGFTGNFIGGEYSVLPTLACMVDMRDLGEDGISCAKGSRGVVEYYCGVRNAGQKGCYVAENSHVYARASEFTGANDRNVWITRTASFEGEVGKFSANKGGDNAIYVSRSSFANLLEADVSNAFKNGIAAIRSVVNAEGCNVSGAKDGSGIIAQRGSRMNAEYVNAKNCSLHGILFQSGSDGSVNSSDVSGSGNVGFRVSGSNVYAQGLIANNCGSFGVWASSSFVDLGGAQANNNANSGIYGSDGSHLNTNGATMDNNTGYGLRVEGGSVANSPSSNARGNTSGDTRVGQGSTINAYNMTTTSGIKQVGDHSVAEFNVIYGANGIIYA